MRRYSDARDQLDSAAIGTLHSFAQRILSENPIEAGPATAGRGARRGQLQRRVRAPLGARSATASSKTRELERALLLLEAAGVRPKALDVLAAAFGDNWDLVAERVPDTAPEPPEVALRLAPAFAELADICKERDACLDPEDRLCLRLELLADQITDATAMTVEEELELLETAASDLRFGVRIGQKAKWPDIDRVTQPAHRRVHRARSGTESIMTACVQQLGAAIRRFTLEAADERRAAGQLEFHDLLVLARSVLRDPESGAVVRERLHQRYQRLLLDEFQDTDPIQIELAVRIAAAEPASADAGDADWNAVSVTAGQLFVVGDPKQSIYRFRRADISTFLAARDRFAAEGGAVVELTTNFRTVAPVIAWVNQVFATLMTEPPDDVLPLASQPDYIALHPQRSAPPEGPPAAVIGREEHPKGTRADVMRAAEAAEVAAAVARAIDERWSVDDGDGGWRPARLGDIAILVPARTSLPSCRTRSRRRASRTGPSRARSSTRPGPCAT